MKRAAWPFLALLCVAAVAAAEETVTVRLGEQDTCTVTDVTTDSGGVLRFDVSSLPPGTRVVRAELRYWIDHDSRLGRSYGFGRYDEDDFAGFQVYVSG